MFCTFTCMHPHFTLLSCSFFQLVFFLFLKRGYCRDSHARFTCTHYNTHALAHYTLTVYLQLLYFLIILILRPRGTHLVPRQTIRSRIFGLSTWAIWELTIAGGKKSIKPFRTGRPRTTCTSIAGPLHRDTTLSSRTFRVEGQVSGERVNLPGIRLLFPSASKIPAWLFPSPYWPRLRLGQYVGSESNRRYFLGLEK